MMIKAVGSPANMHTLVNEWIIFLWTFCNNESYHYDKNIGI